MRVFLSWSGMRSKHVALVLREWLPKVIQALEPWMSDEDIASGTRWPSEIAGALEESTVGIVVLTPENQKAEWLLFESGALSKTLNDSTLLIPYLFGMTKSQLTGPLAQFQAEEANRAGTFSLLTSLNKALGANGIPQSTLEESFEVWWPRLEEELAKAPEQDEAAVAERPDREVISEILENTREQLRREEGRSQRAGQSTGAGTRLVYEVFSSGDGRYHWSLARGQVIAVSEESYATAEEAVTAAEKVREQLGTVAIVESNDLDTPQGDGVDHED